MPTIENTVTGQQPAFKGVSPDGWAVEGWSENAYGVAGVSKKSAGVRGTSSEGRGAEGWSETNWGVAGVSKTSIGVHGQSESGAGVVGRSVSHTGVEGWSETGEGIHAETKSPTVAAIAAYNLNPDGTGAAIFAKKEGNQGHAGFFAGNVHVTGALTVQGINMIAFIQQLQQRIADLEAMLPRSAHIDVQQSVPAHGGVAYFVITGEGFRPNVHININVYGRSSAPNVINSDSAGKLNTQVQIACVAGETLSISVFDPNHPNGQQVSNTETVNCT